MLTLKRSIILVASLALALSGLGILTVRAADTAPQGAALAQADGEAWLGVRISDVRGVVRVWLVEPGSPADDAGLRIGDVIVAVDGEAVDSAEELVEMIQAHAPGDEVTLTLEWQGDERDVTVALAERPAEPQAVQPVRPFRGVLNFLGVSAEWTDDGLLINEIESDSPLADSGLQAGDVITAINGESVTDLSASGLLRALRFDDERLVITVLRDGEEQDIEIELDLPGISLWPSEPGLGIMAQPAQLGVRFRTLTPDLAEEEGLAVSEGALIDEVLDDTPAAEAGLRVGDIITAVDGDAVDQEHTLPDRLQAYEEGDVVTLSVLRGGEELELEVTLGPRAGVMWYGGEMPDFAGPSMFMMPFGHMDQDFWNAHPRLREFFGNLPFRGRGGMGGFRFEVPDIAPDIEAEPTVPGTSA